MYPSEIVARMGFNYIVGLGEASITRLLAAREQAPFRNLSDLRGRSHLPRASIERLIRAGALNGWHIARRQLLRNLRLLRYEADELDLILPSDAMTFPVLSPAEAVDREYAATGLSTGDHVLARYHPWLRANGILSSGELAACAAGQRVLVAEGVVQRQAG
jgi:error-prone DNA polymerase